MDGSTLRAGHTEKQTLFGSECTVGRSAQLCSHLLLPQSSRVLALHVLVGPRVAQSWARWSRSAQAVVLRLQVLISFFVSSPHFFIVQCLQLFLLSSSFQLQDLPEELFFSLSQLSSSSFFSFQVFHPLDFCSFSVSLLFVHGPTLTGDSLIIDNNAFLRGGTTSSFWTSLILTSPSGKPLLVSFVQRHRSENVVSTAVAPLEFVWQVLKHVQFVHASCFFF